MARWITYSLLSLAVLLALIVLLGAAGVAYLNSAQGQQRLAGVINARIPGTLSWEALTLSPLEGALKLENLKLRDPQGGSALLAARLALDWEWLPLARGRIALRRLHLDRLRLNIEGQSPGDLNIVRSFLSPDRQPAPADSNEGPLPLDLMVKDLRVREAELKLAPAPAWPGIQLHGLAIQAQGELAARTARLNLAFEQGTVIYQGRPVALEAFNFSLPLSPAAAGPLALSLNFPGGGLELQGAIQDPFGARELDLSAVLTTDGAHLGRLALPGIALAGRLNADINARGALSDPRLDLQADWKNGEVQGIFWDQLETHLGFHQGRLTIKSLALSAFGGTTTLDGQLDLGSPVGGPPGTPAYELRLNAENLRTPKLPFSEMLPAGTLTAAFGIQGAGLTPSQLAADFSGRATLELDALPGSSDPGALDLHLDSRLKGAEVGITRLDLAGAGARLGCQGRLNWQDQTFEAHYSASLEDLGHLARLVGILPLDGALQMAGKAGGSWKHPNIELNLSGQDLGVQRVRLGELNADLRLDRQGRLTMADLRLNNQGSRLSGRGEWSLPGGAPQAWRAMPLTLDLDIAHLLPADFLPNSPASGSFKGRVSLAGSLEAPRGEIDLQGADLAALGYRLGDLQARLQLAERQIAVDRFHLENRRSRVEMQGTLLLPFGPDSTTDSQPEEMDLALTADPFFLEDFLPKLKGALALKARLTGTLKAPQGEAELEAAELTLYGQALSGATARVRLTPEGVTAEELVVTLAPGEQIQGQGRYGFDGGIEFELGGSNLHLRQVEAWNQRDLPEGRLALQAAGEGTLADPRIRATLQVDQMDVEGRKVPELNADLLLAGKLISLEADIGFPLEATYDLAEGGLTARSRWTESDLSPYFRLAGQPDLGGRISGEVTLAGKPADPESLDAALNVSLLTLTRQGSPLLQSANLKGALNQGRWRLAPADLVLLGRSDFQNQLRMSGQGTLDGALEATLKGTLPAALSQTWLDPEWSPEGELGVDLSLSGKLTEPQLKGSLELKALGLSLPEGGQKLHRLNGTIAFSSQAVTFSQVTGMLDAGRFRLEGGLALADFRPDSADLRLVLDALPLDIPETLALTANADLKLSGTPQALMLSGKAVLLEGSYTRDIDLARVPAGDLDEPALSAEGDGTAAAFPADSPDLPAKTWKDNLKFNVALTQRDPLLVENNLANLDIAFDLNLRGTLKAPALSGRAEVLSGEVSYPVFSGGGLPLGSLLPTRTVSFEVTRGVLDFINPYAIEPELDIAGQTGIREWVIFLELKGVPDALEFELSSQPAESEADILSLLLIGKTSNELAKGGGGEKLSPQQLAQTLFGSSLTGNLQRAAGLDILETQTASDAEGQSTGTEVTVGRHISDRLTVKYSMGTEEGERLERAVADYRLSPTVIARGYRDSLGRFGGTLRWRLEFR